MRTLETVPWPTLIAFFLTFRATTLTVFRAEKPPDSAMTVNTPGVSATNFPSSFITAEAGKPIPYSARPVKENVIGTSLTRLPDLFTASASKRRTSPVRI